MELTTSYQGSKDEPLVLRPLDQGPWFERPSFSIPFIHKKTQTYSIEKLFYFFVLSVASKKVQLEVPTWNCTTISNMKTDLIGSVLGSYRATKFIDRNIVEFSESKTVFEAFNQGSFLSFIRHLVFFFFWEFLFHRSSTFSEI